MQALVEAAQVGEAGQESQHVNEVIVRGVDVHDLLRGEPGVLGHVGQVRAVLAAVAHGYLHDLAH